ncbi:MAG: phosphate signaling complex protein PhoU [Candidatus Aminicenantes bacterium]|nr:phosphate signaling complex protein PhoU [Candidatus Aminicenantes bacterium]
MLKNRILELKEKLMEMASLVETMLENSKRGLVEKKRELLLEIIEKKEPVVNSLEIEIDEFCTELIALYQPKASDLRIILTVLKINNDLERIGDHAENISQSALFLIERPQIKPLIDIPRMADEAIQMIKDSITAFLQKDTALASSVLIRDDIVDNLRDQVIRELITYMASDPTTIERALELIRIAHNLERAADLATNLSEDVIFMVEGKIVKHGFDGT